MDAQSDIARNANASLTEQLAAFSASARLQDIPDSVIDRATISLIHNIAIALAGRVRENACHVMAKQHWALPAEATLLYDGARVSVEGAALANGALMHARSQDDTHAGSTSHPGAPVMAAALAVAEAEGRSGAEFLEAVILGYEILCRIGRDFDHLISKRGFRAAGVFGGFGAAAAAAKLMRLTPSQTAHALGLAAQFAAGLSQVWVEGSAEYPLQLGFPARNGILAARAAQAGVTAAREMLEGRGGFYRAYADTGEPAREILEGLGESWQLSEVTVKLYPVCAILQGPVGSMVQLARTEELAPDAVERIEIRLNPFEAGYAGIDNPGPFSSSTATKMSAQFSLAASLLDQRLTLGDLSRLNDPAIVALAQRVRVISDPAVAPRLSELKVEMRNGRMLSNNVTAAVGQPDIPEIREFARMLAPEAGTNVEAMDEVTRQICALREAASLKPLFAALGQL